MKVHYENIVDALRRADAEATRNNRVIDRFELTPSEWHEYVCLSWNGEFRPTTHYTFNGIRVVKGAP